MKKLLLLMAAFVAVVSLNSCEKDSVSAITVNPGAVSKTLPAAAGEYAVTVTTNAAWIADVKIDVTDAGNDWVTPSIKSGDAGSNEIKLTVTANDGGEVRTATLVIKDDNGVKKEIAISQNFNATDSDLATAIKDAKFNAFVLKYYDKNGDKKLSRKEADKVTRITAQWQNIESIEGVDIFKNLEVLEISNNKIPAVLNHDFSANTKLRKLIAQANKLTSVDLSTIPNLEGLDLQNNSLTTIDLSKNPKLTQVDLGTNKFATLDFSKNQELTFINCAENELTSLNVKENYKLVQLFCFSNKLTTLDVYANVPEDMKPTTGATGVVLEVLSAYKNELTSIDVTCCDKLTSAVLDHNKLSELNIAHNGALTQFDTRGNNDPFKLICFTGQSQNFDKVFYDSWTEIEYLKPGQE